MFFVTRIRHGGSENYRQAVISVSVWKPKVGRDCIHCPAGCAQDVEVQVYDSGDKTYVWCTAAKLIEYVQKEGTEIEGMSWTYFNKRYSGHTHLDNANIVSFKVFKDPASALLARARLKLVGVDVDIHLRLEKFSQAMVCGGVLSIPVEVKGVKPEAYNGQAVAGVHVIRVPWGGTGGISWLENVKDKVLPDLERVEFPGDIDLFASDFVNIKLNIKASGKISLRDFDRVFDMASATPYYLRPDGIYTLEDSTWRHTIDFDNQVRKKKKIK